MESADNREQSTTNNQLSRIETLKLLNESIDQLEEVIESINASSSNNLPPSTTMNTLVATTQKLATAVTPTPTVAPTPVAPSELTKPPQQSVKSVSSPPEAAKTKISAVKARQITKKASKNKTLGLIGIGISAIAVIIVAVFWLWLPKHPVGFYANPRPIGTENTEIVTTTDIDSTNPETTEISKTPLISPEEVPTEIPSNTNTPAESLTADGNLELKSPAEIPIPQDLVSPGRPKDLKVNIIEPEQVQLTPEQTLVAALQTKVAEMIQDYPEDLLNSIEVDFGQHSSVVKVSDLWYKLSESRQTKLANQILERSRTLDLTKLELKDIGGTLVARNPVVGNQVIILERIKESGELQE